MIEQKIKISGFEVPRECALTDRDDITERALLFDWEAADKNGQARHATDNTWVWVLEKANG